MANGAAIGAAACTCCTCLFALVALGIPIWTYALISTPLTATTTVEMHTTAGLWQGCAYSADDSSVSFSNCGNIDLGEITDCDANTDNFCMKLNTVRAFSSLTVIALCASLVGTILMITGQSLGWLVTAITAVVASFCSLIAFGVFAGQVYHADVTLPFYQEPFSYNVGFALQVCVFLFSLIIAGLAFAGKDGGGNGSV